MKYDHLSSDKFWDLVYETAKNRKKKRKVWKDLMSPSYAEVILHMSNSHIKRLEKDLEIMNRTGYSDTPGTKEQKQRAKSFIETIRGSAINSIEKARAEEKNIRKYAKVGDLYEYIAYLKDAIEDLYEEFVVDDELEFPFSATLEDYLEGQEGELSDWISSRRQRR